MFARTGGWETRPSRRPRNKAAVSRAASIPSFSRTNWSAANPRMKNAPTERSAVRWLPRPRADRPVDERTHDRRELLRQGEEAEELSVLPRRRHQGDERSARRLARPDGESGDETHDVERLLRLDPHSRGDDADPDDERDPDRPLRASRSVTGPNANAPSAAVTWTTTKRQ